MRIVYCHNYYRHRGGEDVSFESDVEMLRSEGHEVVVFTRDNADMESGRPVTNAVKSLWNRETGAAMTKLLATVRPDVLHCNNLFPQISVSVYQAAKRLGIPVVQALRNYRSFCANSFLYRDGQICTQCLHSKAAWQGLRYRCYRNSLPATAAVVGMQFFHRLLRVQERYVDAFFTPTSFSRKVHIEGGYFPGSLFVRSNFMIPDLGMSAERREHALFVGRLSKEKGVETLIDAWQLAGFDLPLRILGSGPEEDSLRDKAQGNPAICFLGAQGTQQVLREIAGARCLLMPSRWFETFGRTIAEAFSRGTPVLASRLGAVAELVDDGVSGFGFEPGDAKSVVSAVQKFLNLSATEETAMQVAARERFDLRFSKYSSYVQLLQVYEFALRNSKSSVSVKAALQSAKAQLRDRQAKLQLTVPSESL